VPDNERPLMINGVAVVSAPVEIDIANAEQLRMVLLEAGSRGAWDGRGGHDPHQVLRFVGV
jgi:hypothetical protein